MAVIARQFREILRESQINVETGKNLTLYSLRHTAIMLRLIKGDVNTLTLARNARTSQQMIDRFYAAHLTTEHVRRQLHGFLPKPVKKAVSAKKPDLPVKEAKKATAKAAPKALKPSSKRKSEQTNG